MTLFWIGLLVFFVGSLVRYSFKSKFYRTFFNGPDAEHRAEQASHKYRPLIVIGGVLQILGCVVGIGSFFL